VFSYDGINHIQQRYTGDDAGIIGRIRKARDHPQKEGTMKKS